MLSGKMSSCIVFNLIEHFKKQSFLIDRITSSSVGTIFGLMSSVSKINGKMSGPGCSKVG